MKLQELLNERRNVFAKLNDLRAETDATGKFTDEAKGAEFKRLDAEFVRLSGEIDEAQRSEAAEREHAARLAMMEADARNKPTGAPTPAADPAKSYEDVFWRYMGRSFERRLADDEMRLLETRGTSTQIGSDNSLGGYTIPQSFSNKLEVMMKYYSTISVFGSLDTSIGGTLKYPSLDDTSVNGAVIGQGTATTVSDLTFGNVLFSDYTVDSKIIKLSAELFNDNQVGLVEQILGTLLPERLGRAINSYITNGTGSSQPFGLTTVATTSALTSASATALTKAELMKAWYKLDKSYMEGPQAGWMMHNTILGYLRTLDLGNTDTVQLFSPAIIAGEPDRLLGKPVWINNALEAANATTGLPVTAKKHIYFGDFSKFVVRKIGGISMSRNDSLYWAERSIGFMGFQRLDSNLINANAIKLITQA